MTSPVWITKRNLGIIEENSYLEFQLEASSAGGSGAVSYNFISGNLPTGMHVTNTGLLVGTPVSPNTYDYASIFTVRATDSHGNITDRNFQVLVSAVEPPTITTEPYLIGSYWDGEYYDFQLAASDDNPTSSLVWKIAYGKLPPGITLDADGKLSGFFYKNHEKPIGYSVGWDRTGWDRYHFDDRNQPNAFTDYQFTVEASDGVIPARRSYMIRVKARDALTVDTTEVQVDTDKITIDNIAGHAPVVINPDLTIKNSLFTGINTTNVLSLIQPALYTTAINQPTTNYLPFITNSPSTLPQIRIATARENTNFAFKFEALDLDGDESIFQITSPDSKGFDQDGDEGFDSAPFDGSDYPMPVQMGLDNETGWYTGQLRPQVLHEKNYQFQVYASKKNIPLRGRGADVNLRVLGPYNRTIKWLTNENLGSIADGEVSGFFVKAISTIGAALTYKIKPNSHSRTPQGIILLPDGMLSGRASFKHFKIDSDHTTFDNELSTFDKNFKFTVVAESIDGTAYEEKTFTLDLLNVNQYPYENLYLRGFPDSTQRRLFKSIMNSEELFPTDLIYRPTDPWFGKAQDLRFLFLSGLNSVEIEKYHLAISKNHYNKKLLLGDVKLAYALDYYYNVIYEVVYLDVIDELEGRDPVTGETANCAQTISLTDRKNRFVSNGITYTQFTPNGLGNMRNRIISSIGISNPNTLPQWMTCIQPDDTSPGKYLAPIGYLPAVVLAYTVPGAGKLIAFRLNQSKFNFNRIEFSTDRYVLDDYLSTNYDPTTKKFIPSAETTFQSTTFDSKGTRFLSSIDHYAGPETYAKYIKFTKSGEFV